MLLRPYGIQVRQGAAGSSLCRYVFRRATEIKRAGETPALRKTVRLRGDGPAHFKLRWIGWITGADSAGAAPRRHAGRKRRACCAPTKRSSITVGAIKWGHREADNNATARCRAEARRYKGKNPNGEQWVARASLLVRKNFYWVFAAGDPSCRNCT
jgi:hypothetical protein